MDDPLGLAEARSTMDRVDTLLVYPRVVTLDGVFDDSGSAGGDAGRALLQPHPPATTCTRSGVPAGREPAPRALALDRQAPPLMVKELTDMPRDESPCCSTATAPATSAHPGTAASTPRCGRPRRC